MMEPDRSKWVIIYPVYLDSKKTLAEGRRIAVSHSCENPTASEIGESCSFLSLAYVLEPEKAYSRDATLRGRIKIQLKQDDGSPVNANIPSRKALMLKVAELVPKVRSRNKKGEPSSGSASTSSGKSGKGGRKKK
ncbi:hypothetical protein GOP47_0002406 [Adiantum capillus-veneris]|uniref:Signal recognition particle 19 kDa protein n=1 Tax=Adiantum capillus-veneris TaxID=13818 RepID=A0A9D4VAJ4_ADICA|nr:hypothetical protein GOP47_0002406 [Adiantum capillus-veneris]